MLKKVLSSSFALLFAIMLFGVSMGQAQNPTKDFENQNSSSKVTHIAQNDGNDDDDDMDWGWIGLIGLAGLLGLRKNDKRS
ncbi:MAG TPA: WGxxGxxG family protein [Bacillaceae bacterium]